MASAINPTLPIDGPPADKTDLRNNLAAAKTEIEALQSANIKTEAGTTITVNASYIGAAFSSVLVLCSNAGAVAVTLAADVPVGKVARLRQGGAGTVTAAAGSGATLQKPVSAAHYTEEQYASIAYEVLTNVGGAAALWGRIW